MKNIDELVLLAFKYFENYIFNNIFFIMVLSGIVIIFSILYGKTNNYICNIISGYLTIFVVLISGYFFEFLLNNISKNNNSLDDKYLVNFNDNFKFKIIDNCHLKNDKNIVIEFIIKLLTQGLLLLILINIINPKLIIMNCVIEFNKLIIILWMFYYLSIYIFNIENDYLYPNIIDLLENKNTQCNLNITIVNLIIIAILIKLFMNHNFRNKYILGLKNLIIS